MFTLVRALTYATIFVGFLLVFLPFRLLRLAGATGPATIGGLQIAGMILGARAS